MLPLAEVVFLPRFPATVEKLTAEVGKIPKDSPIALSSGDLVVKANVSPAQRQRVDVGMPVEVNTEGSDTVIKGRVNAIGELVASGEGGAFSHPVTIITNTVIPAAVSGADIRVTVVRNLSRGEVLAVPQSAVFTSADGSSWLLQPSGTGKKSLKIAVETGVVGAGYVQVTPASGDQLSAGDEVIVGDEGAMLDGD